MAVMWITPFLNEFYECVNVDPQLPHYSREICLGFVMHECMIMSYTTSPDSYFSDDTPGRYRKPPLSIHVTKGVYYDILRRISSRYKPQPLPSNFAETWAPPLSPNIALQRVQESLRMFCSKFGFVKKVSILSLDDDLVRLRSLTVESSIGSSRVRNPKKGYGPQQHGLVSLLTGLYLGGHIPNINEGTVQSVKCLFLALAKATGEINLEEQMLGKIPNIVALDRGYLYEDVLKVLTSYGSVLIGTLKRCYLSPFVYGTARKYAHQKIVQEKGPKVSVYARQCIGVDGSGQSVSSIVGVHRNGCGGCFMTHTTSDEFGPGKWAYVVKSIDMRPQQSVAFDGDFKELEATCLLWTATQRTVEWHVFRAFRVTSTTAVCMFCAVVKKNMPEDRILYSYVLEFLGIQQNNFHNLHDIDMETEEVQDLSGETYESLMARRKEELREMCQIRNLRYGGNKTDLVQRLMQFHCHVVEGNIDLGDEIPDPLLSGVTSSWLMKPKMTTSMKLGALNETNILPRIGPFWDQHFPIWTLMDGESYSWHTYTEYGLIGNRNHHQLATSVDAMALVIYNLQEQRIKCFCAVELKTATTAKVVQRAERLADEVGKFVFVNFNRPGSRALFFRAVPDVGHRCQVIHHAVTTGTFFSL